MAGFTLTNDNRKNYSSAYCNEHTFEGWEQQR